MEAKTYSVYLLVLASRFEPGLVAHLKCLLTTLDPFRVQQGPFTCMTVEKYIRSIDGNKEDILLSCVSQLTFPSTLVLYTQFDT